MLARSLAVLVLSAACSAQRAVVSLERATSVGLPVWLKIPVSDPVEAVYPFALDLPAGFGCKQVEVRRKGKMLTAFASLTDQVNSSGFSGGSGNPCGSLFRPTDAPALLPLHLRYKFDEPGVYEVRYTAKGEGFTSPRGSVEWTEWTRIEIQPGSPQLRARWLAEMAAHPPADSLTLLTDFLPSILGFPDRESLQLLRPYLYHPDPHVRRYTGIALTYWPADQAEGAVKEWLRATGPSDGMIHYLSRGRYNALPDFDLILRTVLPYLKSKDPVLVGGAVRAAYHLTGAASKASPELRRRAEKELIDAQANIRKVGDPGTISQLDSLLELLPRLR